MYVGCRNRRKVHLSLKRFRGVYDKKFIKRERNIYLFMIMAISWERYGFGIFDGEE